MAEVRCDGVKVTTFDGEPVERRPAHHPGSGHGQKGGFKHFLAKEIHEQPQAMADTMLGRIRQEEGDVACRTPMRSASTGRGSSGSTSPPAAPRHSGLVGKFLLERWRASRSTSITRASSATGSRSSARTCC